MILFIAKFLLVVFLIAFFAIVAIVAVRVISEVWRIRRRKR